VVGKPTFKLCFTDNDDSGPINIGQPIIIVYGLQVLKIHYDFIKH